MKYCFKCGKCLNDDDRYCPRCGQRQPELQPDGDPFPPAAVPDTAPTAAPSEAEETRALPDEPAGEIRPPYGEPQSAADIPVQRQPALLYFIWSLILVVILNPIGTPLGIAGVCLCHFVNSGNDTEEEAERHIDLCRILCVIGTCIDALCLLTLIVAAILSTRFTF